MNVHTPDLKGEGLRIGIVWSRFNEEIVRGLLTACDKQLVELGVAADDIYVMSVPGALELPLALQTLALERRGFGRRFDALVALGAVVRGETYHFEVVANESARGRPARDRRSHRERRSHDEHRRPGACTRRGEGRRGGARRRGDGE